MCVFASLGDRGRLLSTENTLIVLDTARIALVHEASASYTIDCFHSVTLDCLIKLLGL